jgi:hypothetical protein
MEEYFKPYWLQAWIPVDNGFGGIEWVLRDGLKVMGLKSKARQAQIRVAEAQGLAAQYDFVTDIRLKFAVNDVLRFAEDNTFYRVTGLGERSPDPAESEFSLWPIELTTREGAGGV